MTIAPEQARAWRRPYLWAIVLGVVGAIPAAYGVICFLRPAMIATPAPPGATTLTWERRGLTWRRWEQPIPIRRDDDFLKPFFDSRRNWVVLKTGRWFTLSAGSSVVTPHRYIQIPDDGFAMLAAMVFFVAIALAAVGQSRRAAFFAGHCAKCGYDLRESPERCPECGTPRQSHAP